MSLSLTAIDNGEKSVTITVTDSSGLPDGTDVVISMSRWNGRDDVQGWVDLAAVDILSGVAETTITLDSFGAWLIAARVTSVPAISNWFFLAVVDSSLDSTLQCELGIVDQIKRLDLEGINDRVYGHFVADDTTATYPCIFVTSSELQETVDADGLNAVENVGVPFRILVCTRDSILKQATKEFLLTCRGRIRRCFSKQRLPTVRKCRWTMWEPGPRLQQFNYPGTTGQNAFELAVTVMTVRCSVRDFRGFGQ